MTGQQSQTTLAISGGKARVAEEFYERAHSNWRPSFEGIEEATPDRVRRVESLIRPIDPSIVLDVGFGDLRHVRWLRRVLPRARHTFIDFDRIHVREATDAGVDALACDISVEPLPFVSRSFDLVVMTEVIEHLYNPDFAIKEIHRVLSQHGTCVLSTPNLAAWYNRILLIAGLQPISTEVSTERVMGRRLRELGQYRFPVGHIRVFTLRALRDFLDYHHFEIDRLLGYSDSRIPLDSIFRTFAGLSSGFALSCHPTLMPE